MDNASQLQKNEIPQLKGSTLIVRNKTRLESIAGG
jgi:hypothetical protein